MGAARSDRVMRIAFQDPNDTVQFAKKSNTNSVTFVCPSAGQVRCQANFNDSDDGPGYSLRGMWRLRNLFCSCFADSMR